MGKRPQRAWVLSWLAVLGFAAAAPAASVTLTSRRAEVLTTLAVPNDRVFDVENRVGGVAGLTQGVQVMQDSARARAVQTYAGRDLGNVFGIRVRSRIGVDTTQNGSASAMAMTSFRLTFELSDPTPFSLRIRGLNGLVNGGATVRILSGRGLRTYDSATRGAWAVDIAEDLPQGYHTLLVELFTQSRNPITRASELDLRLLLRTGQANAAAASLAAAPTAAPTPAAAALGGVLLLAAGARRRR